MKALLSLSLVLVAVSVDEEDECVPPKEVDINDAVGPKREARKGRVEAGKHSLDREEGREKDSTYIFFGFLSFSTLSILMQTPLC